MKNLVYNFVLFLSFISFRERLERPHEGETEPRKNTKMLKKRGDR